MTRLLFVVPCHGRERLAAVCLRQLARTCEAMREYGIKASAVVIADDANLDTARSLGFVTVERDNSQLGRKFNDGFQAACDPEHNPYPADFVVPCGSDDWIDPSVFQTLPPDDAIGVFHQMAVVDETRSRLARLNVIGYAAGVGPRIIPRRLLELAGYRPAEEHRKRAIDGSTYRGLWEALGRQQPRTVCLDVHALQIVDWKSSATQLNTYESLRGFQRAETEDPFVQLAAHYPAEAIEEMRALA